jgi:hypothetical protein
MFQVRVAKSVGMGFQNLFSEIMRYARSDFTPVKPQGPEGDWKNDGHEPAAGRYYQVYAPERLEEARAVTKLQDDFAGLLIKWGDAAVYPIGVQEFYFVINDAYRITPGSYPTTIAALEALRNQHGLKVCKPFLSKDLEDILLDLPDDKINAVLGFPPNPADIQVLQFDLVNEVIRHIVENSGPRSLLQTLNSPDFDEKIAFNDLAATGFLLRDGAYRRGSLEDYFSAQSNFTRQEVRNRLKALYDESAQPVSANGIGDALASDARLFYILDRICPTLAEGNPRLVKEIQDAALVVMAYFFEACDIFKEPPSC